MVEVSDESEIPDAFQEFKELIGRQVTDASGFYTLYYLSEIKGETKYDFDLSRVVERQSDALYNYSIYATIREIGHLNDQFAVDGRKFYKIKSPATASGLRKESAEISENKVREYIEDEAGPAIKDMVKTIMFDATHSVKIKKKEDIALTRCIEGENEFNAFTESGKFLRACSFIFGSEWPKGVHWSGNYGGEAWESVCDTALMKHEMGDIAYVDLMWSVEHNTGGFTDKLLYKSNEEVDTLVRHINNEIKKKRRELAEHIEFVDGRRVRSSIQGSLIHTVLTFARNENIRPLFNIAKRRFDVLNDRRLREDMFPLEQELLDDNRIMNMVR